MRRTGMGARLFRWLGRAGVAWLAGIVALLLGWSVASSAEPVSVNRNSGQGFVVTHRGNCYVILPHHVHGDRLSLSLSAGAPPVIGQAWVFEMFAPGTDLSIGIVTGGMEGRCTDAFAELPQEIDALVSADGAVSVVVVSDTGVVRRMPGHVGDLSYETMLVDLEASDTGTGIARGTSGALVFAGDTAVGMVVRAFGRQRAEALRMDAIVSRLDRLLEGALDPIEVVPTPVGTADGTGSGAALGIVGLATAIAACSAEPVTPEASCWSMASGVGPLLVPPETLPLVIEIEVGGGDVTAVRSVRLRAGVDGDSATIPQTVLVERQVRTGTGGQSSWLSFGRGDMSPLGTLRVDNGAAPRTRALRLTILDAWAPALPMRLDSIEIR